jgi:hypothetical protein
MEPINNSQRAPEAPEPEMLPDIAKLLEKARQEVQDLAARTKTDPGAPFEPATLAALAALQQYDPRAWARIQAQLKSVGIPMRTLLQRLKSYHLQIVRPGEGKPRTTYDALGDDCPAPQLIVPDPYSLHPDATCITRAIAGVPQSQTLAFSPIMITARLRNAEDGTEMLRLVWKRTPGEWLSMDVDRGVAMDARRLLECASRGFPVASDNSREIAKYLHAFEARNYHQLEQINISSHLGWQGRQGESGFLWGHELLAAADAPGIQFHGGAEGADQIAAGFHSRGTIEGWRATVTPLHEFPRALIGFYTAFVPPLLMILQGRAFVLDLCSKTTVGKTTILRVAASVWGCPDEHDPNSLLRSWYTTQVGVERLSAILTSLPLILDESKLAPEGMIQAVVYGYSSGQGRNRGNTRSLARTGTWNGVLLSSGEAPLTSYTNAGGVRTRCLEIRGLPFNQQDVRTAEITRELNIGVLTDYGHAGPALVRYLVGHRDEWDAWRQHFNQETKRYAAVAAACPEGQRLAEAPAAISTAINLVHAAINLPWDAELGHAALDRVFPEMISEVDDASGEERALRAVMSWAASREETFHGREQAPSNRRWSGRWDPGEGYRFIGFYPTVLEGALRELGFEPGAILPGWKRRGWLDTKKDRESRYTKQVRIKDSRSEMIVLRRSAVDEVNPPEGEGGKDD